MLHLNSLLTCLKLLPSNQTCILGWGHTNYDIQIIVVILKVTTRFFQQRPWIGKIIMIVLGSHVSNMNYEVYCGSALADSIVNNEDIGLSEHL